MSGIAQKRKRCLLDKFNAVADKDCPKRKLKEFEEELAQGEQAPTLLNLYIDAVGTKNFTTDHDLPAVVESLKYMAVTTLLENVMRLDRLIAKATAMKSMDVHFYKSIQRNITKHLLDREIDAAVVNATDLFQYLGEPTTASDIATKKILAIVPELCGEDRGELLSVMLNEIFDLTCTQDRLAIVKALLEEWDPSMAWRSPDVCALLAEGPNTTKVVLACVEQLTEAELYKHDIFKHVAERASPKNNDIGSLLALLDAVRQKMDLETAAEHAFAVVKLFAHHLPGHALCMELCSNQPNLPTATRLRTRLLNCIDFETDHNKRAQLAKFFGATLNKPDALRKALDYLSDFTASDEEFQPLLVALVESATIPANLTLDDLRWAVSCLEDFDEKRGFANSEVVKAIIKKICPLVEALSPDQRAQTMLTGPIIALMTRAQALEFPEPISRMLAVTKDRAANHLFKNDEMFTCLTQLIMDLLGSVDPTLMERALDVLGDLFVGLPVNEITKWLLVLFHTVLGTPLGENKQLVINFLTLFAPECMSKEEVLESGVLIKVQLAAPLMQSLDFAPLLAGLMGLVDDRDAVAELGDLDKAGRQPVVCDRRRKFCK